MRRVALFRAVNVGRTQMSAASMRSVVSGLGFFDVTTYLQSGNVCFSADDGDERDFGAAIEQAIESELGQSVRVLTRRADELTRLVAENPFLSRGAPEASLHVTFLAGSAEPGLLPSASQFAPDDFLAAGNEVYVCCPSGYGRTKLNNSFFERRLGRVATTRNWRTVCALETLAKA